MRLALLLLTVCAIIGCPPASADGRLVLYTSQPDDVAAATVAAFRRHAPDVQVDIFRSGTTEIMGKLSAEFMAGAPRPDVLLIADAVSMLRLKQDGRLLAYPEADVAAMPPGAFDPDRTYFATKLITTGIVVNTRAPFTPHTWRDLLAPAANGQVVLASPLYSGAATIGIAAMADDSALGPDFLRQLAGNGAVSVPGNGAVLAAVAGGQNMFGIVVDFMALAAQARGSPVRFVFPSDGVPSVTEPVAILKTSSNQAAARALVDFLLSRDGQVLAASQGFLPVRTDVPPPPGFPASLHLLPEDIGRILGEEDRIRQEFADLFGG
jgi:iron(III) transport system substrate-binding protein